MDVPKQFIVPVGKGEADVMLVAQDRIREREKKAIENLSRQGRWSELKQMIGEIKRTGG